MDIKTILILILGTIILSGCSSAVYVDDGVIRTPEGDPIVGEHTGSVIIENYFSSCVHNSFGDDCFVVRKFGESNAITTGIVVPVANGEVYQTPQTITQLQIVSDNINDNIIGTGARTIKITGLSTNWEEVTEIVELNGIIPVILNNSYFRVYGIVVETSGSYANTITPSHLGTIDLKGVVGGELWARIGVNGVNLGQSEIGVYTVPKGYHAHLGNMLIHNNGNKQANIYLFVRNNASNTIAPYDSMRIQFQAHGVTESLSLQPMSISGGIPETSDIGFMANTDVGTTETSVNFEILLIKND